MPLLYTRAEITVFLLGGRVRECLREQPGPPNSKTFGKHTVNIISHTSCSFYDWSIYTVVETETVPVSGSDAPRAGEEVGLVAL